MHRTAYAPTRQRQRIDGRRRAPARFAKDDAAKGKGRSRLHVGSSLRSTGRSASAFGVDAGPRASRSSVRPRTDRSGRVLNPPSRSPELSVVIVTRDGLRRLEPCLESVALVLGDTAAEVIVVDNGSRDPL